MKSKTKLRSIVSAVSLFILFLVSISSTALATSEQSASPIIAKTQITTDTSNQLVPLAVETENTLKCVPRVVTVGKTGEADFVCSDYASDDACIQAAINYAALNNITELWIFDGVYTISKQIKGTANLNLRGIGEVTLISNQVSGSIPEIFKFSGYEAATTKGLANVSAGALSISVNDTSKVSIGDLLLIYDDTIWGDGTDYPTWKTGEIHEVTGISGTTISFTDGLLHAYTTGNNLTVKVINPIQVSVENIEFKGASATTTNGLISLIYNKNSDISNCDLSDGGMFGIAVYNSYNTYISENKITNFEMNGSGYGVMVSDTSAHTKIYQNKISLCRHCIASGGRGKIGQPRDICITKNTLFGGSDHIIDAHAIVESIYARDNLIYGGAKPDFALDSGAKISVFAGNIVYNACGASIRDSTKDIVYIVENNLLCNCTYVFRDSKGDHSCTEKQVKISNNHMVGSVDYLAYVTAADSIQVEGNSIDQSLNYYGMYLDSVPHGIISANLISSSQRCGMYLTGCSNLLIENNIISESNGVNKSGQRYEAGISLDNCTNLTLENNLVTDSLAHQRYAIREYGTSDSNIIKNNKVSGAITKQISTLGSSTVVRDNIGYTTENTGTAIIKDPSTSVNVSHGLAATPTRIILCPSSSTDGKVYYISAKTASNFTITIDSPAIVDINFDWSAVV